MAQDYESTGENLFRARTPDGTSGSLAGQQLAVREASAINPQGGITVGTETANVIPVTIQLEEGDGSDIAEAATFVVSLIDADGIEALAAAFTLGLTGGGSGTLVTNTGQARVIATTDAAGLLNLDCTDVVGASGATIYAMVKPLNATGITTYAAITFD